MSVIDLKQYLKSILLYIFIIIVLVSCFCFLFQLEGNDYYEIKTNSIGAVKQIFLRNSQNFFQYIIFAPIMPLFYIMDCISTAWSLAASLQINGGYVTIRNLLPHGIIEIPNFCLYTLISYKICRYFYVTKNMKFKKYFYKLCQYKIIILICELMIILAAFLEGIVT